MPTWFRLRPSRRRSPVMICLAAHKREPARRRLLRFRCCRNCPAIANARTADAPGIILAPTRELAAQIGESIATYGRFLHVSHTVIFGGVGQRPQELALDRGVDIVVATPGRLLDLMGQGHVDLSQVRHSFWTRRTACSTWVSSRISKR